MNDFSTQHYFKLFTEAYPGLVSYIDQDYRYQFVSDPCREWFKVEPAEMMGKQVVEILGEASFAIRKPFMERALKGEKVIFQSSLNHLKLGLRDTKQIYHPDIDDQGVVKGIFALAQDVTDEVKARKIAEEKEATFRSYTESMPQLAFIANPKGEIIYFNKRWEEYSGKNPYELDGITPQVFHPEDFPKVKQTWEDSIKDASFFQLELRIRNKAQEYRWHLAHAIPLKNPEGIIRQWIGTITDIHDYKEIEAQQARLIQVMESSTDFVAMANLDGKIIFMNGAGRKMMGVSPEQDITRFTRMQMMFEEDLKFYEEVIVATMKSKGNWIGEYRLKNVTTNQDVWVHYNNFVVRDAKTKEIAGFATIARDLSEIKAKERNLESALRTRDEFLSIASHELKTPLTSLKLQAQLFLRSLKKGDQLAVSKERLENMAVQSNELVSRLSRLIDDMLDVSRIRTGKLNLDKSHHDLADITRNVLGRLSMQFQAAGVESPTIQSSEVVEGFWDSFRIEQVLINLLTNAIRYGQGKSIEIDIRQVGDRAILKVTDHGYGISQIDQQRIFGRFERAINASEVSGMGLGLFITKEIIKSHEGEISVKSELGHGATFIVDLPIKA